MHNDKSKHTRNKNTAEKIIEIIKDVSSYLRTVVVSSYLVVLERRAGFSLSRALFRKKCGGPSLIYESPD